MAKALVARKRKAANGYEHAERLPIGEILQDVTKKKWKLGQSIGQGGFGEIYSAQDFQSSNSKYPFVIKIEPHKNGPLFVEMHFYMKHARPSDIIDFKNAKHLKTFGMPAYYGSGSHEYKGQKYRFLVMEKFGTDLLKIFLENKKIFPSTTAFKIAIQILDVLEYIHQRGYVHADIKAANVLLGTSKDTENKQVYLVDFGLATKYTEDQNFKPNPKKAHDGTIEYLSRDAHKGVQTRRGDLEILAYNLIHWLGGKLPWEQNLKDLNAVHKSKEEFMENIPKSINACFSEKTPPDGLIDFFSYLLSLKHNSEPNYYKIRQLFLSNLEAGDSLGKPFQFSLTKKTPQKRTNKSPEMSPKRNVKKRNYKENTLEDDNEQYDDKEETKIIVLGRRGQPRVDYSESPKDYRRTKKPPTKNIKAQDNHVTGDNFAGYTDAMKEILMKRAENKKPKSKKKAVSPKIKENDSMEGYTASMKEIALKKKQRFGKNKETELTTNASTSGARRKKQKNGLSLLAKEESDSDD